MDRYIKVLPDIPMTNIAGEQIALTPMSRFVDYRTIDPAYADQTPAGAAAFNGATIISGERVRAAFHNAKVGDHIDLSGEDYERLRRATEFGSYDATVAGSLIPFIRAILDARTTKELP